ncbi:MAG: gamma-glutamylcyclotransferase family protein [Paracoccaceae bacterium]
MAEPYFFGYGSLVNLATHDFPNPHQARLRGWRRTWRHTDLREVAFLTIEPDPECEIEGMIAHVPNNDWAALDEREWAYDRLPASEQVTHPVDRALDVAIYTVPTERASQAGKAHPILLSYLDVVVQGYLNVFGTQGAVDFFATTSGWDAPVLDDRAAPIYPRHQQLNDAERSVVDGWLRDCDACLMPMSDRAWKP